MLDEDIDSHHVLIVPLVDRQCLFIQPMVGGNLGNLPGIIILQLVDVAYNFALLSSNSRQKKEVLQVCVVAEWRGLNDDLL